MKSIPGGADRNQNRFPAARVALEASPEWKALPNSMKPVASFMAERIWRSTGIGYVSAAQIAARFGCDLRTAQRSRARILRGGALEVRVRGGGRGRANGYCLPARIADRPPDNRPATRPAERSETAGQVPRNYGARAVPLEVPSFVNYKTREQLTRGPEGREKPKVVEGKQPTWWRGDAPACAACGDGGWLTDHDGRARRCECDGQKITRRVLIDTTAPKTAPDPPDAPLADLGDSPLQACLARLRARQRERPAGPKLSHPPDMIGG